ncbi:MAG: radical SAM protein [Planctomycetota bacterium]
MKIKLICPSWQRLQYQTHYVLPPLGITVVAALTPDEHEVVIEDENVELIDFDEPVDLVGISTMLVSQAPRAFEVADTFRARGVKVVIGGLTASCIPEQAARHADAVVIGEAEGIWRQVVEDLARDELKPTYRRAGFADAADIPRARRDLLKPEHYTYRGVRMMDLIETSRGCRFGCFPCQVPHVAGKEHRIRDISEVVDEMAGVDCDRVFIVDNALEQNEEHQLALFQEMKRAEKSWVSHPISTRPDILQVASDSGCWFVYQAIFGDTPKIREKIKQLHDYGIGVQGTILLGLDGHGPDIFERMVEFLLDCDLDLAEFTVLTPFPGTPFFDQMKKAGRLLHEDWGKYNAENVVFKPARMTPDQLQEGYQFAWDAFYKEESQPAKMFGLYKRLKDRRRFSQRIGEREERPIPYQKGGSGALWGGVVEK